MKAKDMKKPQGVVDAEAALDAKAQELSAAKETLKRLEREYSEAYTAVRHSQTDSDSALPQCRLVLVRWRSGVEDSGVAVVIVRRTPGGMLVVRHVGDSSGNEYKFKWAEHAGKYRQAEKSGFTSDIRQLRDVPLAYLPSGQAA